MGNCNTLKNGIGRREYLTLLAVGGAATIGPVRDARAQATNDGELFRETTDTGGATATVSDTGDIIAFGVYGGEARIYIADGGEYNPVEFLLPEVSSGVAASHVAVSEETNNIVAAAMDEDTFGGGNLENAGALFGTPTMDAEWAYEVPGLWDIGTSTDLTTVVAVSASEEVAPHIVTVRDGRLAWEQPIDDAAGMAVEVSDDGQYIAVGCAYNYDGIDRTGQPGVQIYSDTGDLLWTHETDEDVIDIGINQEADIVLAGVDDLSTLAFDLDGELLWQHDDSPTMTALSGDGSTLIASPPVSALDTRDGSLIWESNISNANLGADSTDVSEDGSRVAVSTINFELFVLEGGETIWEDENESGPYYSAISADGTTLASIEVNNDAQNAELVGNRL